MTTFPPKPSAPAAACGRCRHRGGFTLTEVLISIALVLVLILGINQVFGLTARAVGTGQAVGEITRAGRAAQTVITQDLSNADFDRGPFLWISMETLPAFRNKEDQARDFDFDPTSTTKATVERSIRTVDRDGNGSDGDGNDLTPRAFMTSRTHRVDQIGFFSRTSSRKQMGNGTAFTASISSNEQYVHYGHLYRPDNTTGVSGAGKHPGISFNAAAERPSTNPNNYYATDWILGRMRFIMREPVISGTGTNPPRYITDDQTGDRVTYYTRLSSANAADQMEPFRQSSQATTDGNAYVTSPSDNIQWSYNDVMGTSIQRARQDLKAYIDNSHEANWFLNPRFRFTGSPLPTRPLTRQGVSRTVPCFVPHCTQFAVEFAGDFVTQAPATGAVSNYAKTDGTGTDGEIDYVVDTQTNKRTIRWYGYPRDVNGDGKIVVADGDVVPVRDVAGAQLGFERTVLAQQPNYGLDTAVPLTASYFVVWGPDVATTGLPRPKMIRITMAVDDPAGRVADEQFFSFVVEVP